VASAARTAHVRVDHLTRLGDTAIAYITTTSKRTTVTCVFAKNGTIVLIYAASPGPRFREANVIALARRAASRF
jgi:hypothetical protein